MIYSTLNQLNSFIIFIFFGNISSFIFSFFSIIFLKFHQKNIKKTIFYAIFYTFLTFFYIFLISVLNFGHYNLSLLFSFITSFYCTNKLSFNLVVFLEQKWYTLLTKFKNKLGFRKRINASKRKEI